MTVNSYSELFLTQNILHKKCYYIPRLWFIMNTNVMMMTSVPLPLLTALFVYSKSYDMISLIYSSNVSNSNTPYNKTNLFINEIDIL